MRKLFCFFLVIAMVLCLCGCSKYYKKYAKEILETESATQAVEPTQAETVSKTEAPTQAETVPEVPVYYEDDETINLYVARYNECHPDDAISSDELKKFDHHGREHDEQVKLSREDFSITITGGSWGYKAEVYVEHLGKSSVSSDDYGEMFVKFAKPYNSELTDEELQGYWQQVVDSSTNTVRFDDFECTKNPSPNIVYFKISGKFE